jgi:hypothetical protein
VRKPMLITMMAAGIAFALGGGALTLATAGTASAATVDTFATPAADNTVPVPDAQRCTVEQLTPTMTSGVPYVDGNTLMRTVSITLTNVGGSACTIAGRPGATLVGTPTGVWKERFTPAATGTAENVTLAAGETAETTIRVRDEHDAAAWEPRTLELALPGSRDYYRLTWPAGLLAAQDALTTVSPLQRTGSWSN